MQGKRIVLALIALFSIVMTVGCGKELSIAVPTNEIHADYSITLYGETGETVVGAKLYKKLGGLALFDQTNLELTGTEFIDTEYNGIVYPLVIYNVPDEDSGFSIHDRVILDAVNIFTSDLFNDTTVRAGITELLPQGTELVINFNRDSGGIISSQAAIGNIAVVTMPVSDQVIGSDVSEITVAWSGLSDDEEKLPAKIAINTRCSVDQTLFTSFAEALVWASQANEKKWVSTIEKKVSGVSSVMFTREELMADVVPEQGVTSCLLTASFEYESNGELSDQFAGGTFKVKYNSARVRFKLAL